MSLQKQDTSANKRLKIRDLIIYDSRRAGYPSACVERAIVQQKRLTLFIALPILQMPEKLADDTQTAPDSRK